MGFSEFTKRAQKLTIDNSPTILTVIGATGVIATAYLTGKAAFKAADVLREAEMRGTSREKLFTLKEKINATWTLYIPAVAVGSVTIAAVVGANQIGSKRTAALAAAYSISQTAVEEYKSKVVERLGDRKAEQIDADLAQDRVNANPIGGREIIIAGNGEVDCYDMYSGRYFRSSAEEIKGAQNNLNYLVNNNMYASLNEFYDFLGLPRIDMGDEVGWTSDKLLDVKISSTLSDKMTPCLAIDFYVKPVRDYFRFSR